MPSSSSDLPVDPRVLMGASRPELVAFAKKLVDLKREAAKVGPQNPDELHALIKEKYGIHIPRVAVDPDHTAPFDLVCDAFFEWETSLFVVGSRESGKTMDVALVHALKARFQPGYEGISSGAVDMQSKRAYSALLKFNSQWPAPLAKPPQRSETLYKNTSKIEVIGGTKSQLNGPHSNLLHRDEAELYDQEDFDEGDNITSPGVTTDGRVMKAIDIVTTSLKKAKGIAQNILDECEKATKAGLKPPYKVHRFGIAETIQNQPNCRSASENAGRPEAELCGCHEFVKGELENGANRTKPRTLDLVCGGRFYKSDGFRDLESVQDKFTKQSRGMWDMQMESKQAAVDTLMVPSFSVERHGVVDWVPKTEYGPIYSSADFGGCYDAETEVLTRRGWVAWPAVTIEDEFASLDPSNEKVEFQHATEIIDKPYHGWVDRWKNNSVDLVVTSDHNMLVAPLHPSKKHNSWELVPSMQVDSYSRMLKGSSGLLDATYEPFVLPGVVDGSGRRLPDLVIQADDWAAVIGLWMAEGHTDLGYTPAGKKRKNGRVGFTHYDKSNVDEIERILSRYFKVSNRVDYEAMQGQLCLNDPRLFTHLRLFKGAGDKYLPEYVKSWSPELLKIMLDWHERGDGSRGRIYTGSRRLADDLQEVSMYCGWGADITVRPPIDSIIDGRQITAHLPQYVVSIKKTQNRPRVHAKPHETPVKTVVTPGEWGNDRVYCAVLPKYHTLYVRRGGKAVWCGNTNAHANNWYQKTVVDVPALLYRGEGVPPVQGIVPAGSLVAFDEVYVAEVGNIAFGNRVIATEMSWENRQDTFAVIERYADIAAKSARLDWANSLLRPLKTVWRIERGIEDHVLLINEIVEDRRFYVDVTRCLMFVAEIKVWERDPKTGKQVDTFNHAMSNFRYAVANIHRKEQVEAKKNAANEVPGAAEKSQPARGTTDKAGDIAHIPATGPTGRGYDEDPYDIPGLRPSAGGYGRMSGDPHAI